MADISAADVMKLRKVTGQGMMDCKAALQDAGGDFDQAVEILRKKGLATLEKRAARETTEGLVISKMADDGKTAVLVSLCCETDFVAKNDDFVSAANKLADYAMACEADEGVDNILGTAIDGMTYEELLTALVSKTGEKTLVGDYARFTCGDNGLIHTYIHFNNKVGTMLEIEANDASVASSDALKNAAADIAMHITATKPLALDRDGIDPKVVEQEKAIFAEQMQNKPPQIIEKIVEGKMNKFYAENCLLAQPFVKDDSKTVEQVLAEAAKAAGGQAKIKRFVRFEVS